MQQSAASAQALASIDRVGAEVSPDRKAKILKDLQTEDRIIAMAGNGIKDASVRCNGLEIRQR